MHSLLSTVICDAFEHEVGTWQAKVEVPKALLVSFAARIDYKTEDGYRYLDLALYAYASYVEVWVRPRWSVIKVADLEYDAIVEDAVPKRGARYDDGQGPWVLAARHASCWREDGVTSFLRRKAPKILGFSSPSRWFQVVPVASLNLPRE